MSSDFLCADKASACKATINVTCLQSTQTTLCAVVEDLCCYVRCWWYCRWVQCPGVTQEHTDHHHSTLISCWWELAQSTLHTEQPDHDKELSQVWNIIQSNSSQWSVVRSIKMIVSTDQQEFSVTIMVKVSPSWVMYKSWNILLTFCQVCMQVLVDIRCWYLCVAQV